MEQSFLYSIGHGNKSMEEFIRELNQFDIKFLIDIRSIPYSKYYPWFNAEGLRKVIKETNKIKYGYMGDSIGGLPPKECQCYTNGKVDYNKLAGMDFFKQGLLRLVNANQKKLKTGIMCSESDPSQCHRTKLIGVELKKMGIELQHIYRTKLGTVILKSQAQVLSEVINNDDSKNTFFNSSENINFTSRKEYV